MFVKIINYINMSMHIIKIKFHLPDLLERIFTKGNISKVLIIFTVGLISRIIIGIYYDVNVFIEYYKNISLIYYSLMAIFVVVLSEIFTYFDFNIIPSFIFEYFGQFRGLIYRFGLGSKSMIHNMFIIIKKVNINIYHLLCGDYINSFSIKSITSFYDEVKKGLCDEVKSEASNIFSYKGNKLTIGHSVASQEHELSNINKVNKPVKVSNVLNKGEDNLLLPKSTYKPSAGTSREVGEGSGSNNRLLPKPSNRGLESDGASSKSKASAGISDTSRSVTLGILGDDSYLREGHRSVSPRANIPTPSSVYSPYDPLTTFSPTQQEGDFPLYDYDSQGSDLATPRTMPPLFGGSNASRSVRTSIHSLVSQSASQRNSNYPAPLNIRQANQANMTLRRNSVLPEPTFSELGYSSSAFTRSNTSINNRPYDLSANGVLPNVAFDQVASVRNALPISNVSYNSRTLPAIPRNYESAVDNVANTPRIDDPCSLDYQSRHRQFLNETRTPSFNRYHYHYKPFISDVSQEIEVKKPGLKGKVKLGFKTLGNKFSNGISKIESAYVHYETVSKRHIIWSLFEENSGQYENYADFKRDWDSNTGLWAEIKDRTKKDLKTEIEGLLGIGGSRPPIGTNLNREIDDLLRNRRPFDRSANNGQGSNVGVQEESSNSQNKNKSDKEQPPYQGNKHVHRKHAHNRSHGHSNRVKRV
jgi:hypothetical protein